MNLILIYIAVIAFIIVTRWTISSKAPKPGRIAIIPMYNKPVLPGKAGKPWWWLVLMFLPVVNSAIAVLV